MAAAARPQLLPSHHLTSNHLHANTPRQAYSKAAFRFPDGHRLSLKRSNAIRATPKDSQGDKGIVPADDEDGVSLGTMKLPMDTDIARFETLLFQWANSLCQGANLPLPVPLKVDKIKGGARLGFTEVDDGKTEVRVHIDCLVFPATDGSSAPLFRAVRNGPGKDKAPPGEPRIMRSLLQALQKSVEIARK